MPSAVVKRLDSPVSAKTKRMDDGTLVCDARISRAGIYTYVLADGSISKEYRAPEEVFKPDSLESFETAPLTLNHPAIGEVNPSNYRQEVRGVVSNVHQDAEAPAYVAATVRIQDVQALAAVADGTVQLSAGYTCLRTPVSGMTVTDPLTGETCTIDAVLTAIDGNHVAIVPSGRAGPGARLILDVQDLGVEMAKLDAVEKAKCAKCGEAMVDPGEKCPNCGEMASGATEPEGVQGDAPKVDPVKDAPGNGRSVSDPQSDAPGAPAKPDDCGPKTDAAAITKELEAARVQVETLKADLAKANEPGRIDALVAERQDVVGKAKAHGLKTDAVSNAELRAAVVIKAFPKLKLDGFSVEQISSLFDSVATPVEVVEAPKADPTVVVALDKNPIDAAVEADARRYGLTR